MLENLEYLFKKRHKNLVISIEIKQLIHKKKSSTTNKVSCRKAGNFTNELFYLFIETFMQGLPYTYRIEIAESETTITIKILSDIGGDWTIIKTESNWLLTKTIDIQTLSTVCIIPETIWKLFSKEITRMQVYEKVTISENQKLEKTAINLIAVMA